MSREKVHPSWRFQMDLKILLTLVLIGRTQCTDSYCCQKVSSMNSRQCTDNQLLLVCDQQNLSNVSQNYNSHGNKGMSHTQPGQPHSTTCHFTQSTSTSVTNKSNHLPQKQNTNQSSKIISNQCDAKSSSKNVDIKMTVTITHTDETNVQTKALSITSAPFPKRDGQTGEQTTTTTCNAKCPAQHYMITVCTGLGVLVGVLVLLLLVVTTGWIWTYLRLKKKGRIESQDGRMSNNNINTTGTDLNLSNNPAYENNIQVKGNPAYEKSTLLTSEVQQLHTYESAYEIIPVTKQTTNMSVEMTRSDEGEYNTLNRKTL